MATHRQPDKIVAIYYIPFPHTSSSDAITQQNLITIYEPHHRIQNAQNYTHVAHVVYDHQTATFLCSYDAPSGVLHNTAVIKMNKDMQSRTKWRWQDDEKFPTEQEQVEEHRAAIKDGIFKKPQSNSIGLCTLKSSDVAGFHYLELRMRGIGAKDDETKLVTLIAKKLTGAPLAEALAEVRSRGLMQANIEAGQLEGQDVKGKGKGKEVVEDTDYLKSFAECLEELNGRKAPKNRHSTRRKEKPPNGSEEKKH